MDKPVVGLKFIKNDYGSMTARHMRLFYRPSRGWQDAPGNGTYIAVTGNLHAGGVGDFIALVEGRGITEASHCAPSGVVCCAEYRVLKVVPSGTLWGRYVDEREAMNERWSAKSEALSKKYRHGTSKEYLRKDAKLDRAWDRADDLLFAGLIKKVKRAKALTKHQGHDKV